MNSLQSLLLRSYRLLAGCEVIVGESSELGDFCLPINQELTLGTPLLNLKDLVGYAETFFKVDRMTCNSPYSDFVFIRQVKANHMTLTLGTGSIDSHIYSMDRKVPMPLNDKRVLPSGSRLSVFGNYTGFVPPGFVQGDKFNFNVTFHGKAYTFDQI